MTLKLTLYTRRDCGLCEEMMAVIRRVAEKIPLELEDIDVDGVAELREELGNEVPVLFINGSKAFKYRVTATELAKRLRKASRPGRGWLKWRSRRASAGDTD